MSTCRQGAPDGPVESIAGTARIVAPGELEVRFSGVPFVAADYWVLWVDADYLYGLSLAGITVYSR